MPCYTPEPTHEELQAYAEKRLKEGDYRPWLDNVRRKNLEQWLCDALHGRPPHPDCLRWWDYHKKWEESERAEKRATQDRQLKREAAKSKLTPNERKLLGIK
jgi:hypothetical protein